MRDDKKYDPGEKKYVLFMVWVAIIQAVVMSLILIIESNHPLEAYSFVVPTVALLIAQSYIKDT